MMGKMAFLACLVLLTGMACGDDDDSGVTGSTGGTVVIHVTNVTVNTVSASLLLEETTQLTAVVLPADAADKSISWSSSNTNAVSVSPTGLVTALATGTSEVTATTTDGGFTARCLVTSRGLGPQVSAFTSGGAYGTNRGWHSSFIHNGYLYVSGGHDGSKFLDTIEYAALADNGTCGVFSSATFPEARAYQSCIAHKGYLYLVAGYGTNDNPTNTILYAPINSNGSPGVFQTATGRLHTARGGFGIAIHADRLYVMGGATGGIGTRSVEWAAIGTDGNVGSFTEVATALGSPRTYCAGAVYNGYLYVAGGRKSGSESHDTVDYAKIQPDGSVGTFTTAAQTFDRPREIFGIAVYNGYLFLAGGYNVGDSSATASIEFATLDPASGAPGSFAYTTNTLPLNLFNHSVQAYHNRIYVIGGYGTQRTVYSAAFLE